MILQGPSPNTVPVSEAIRGQNTNSGDGKVSYYVRVQQSCTKVRCQAETPDRRLVEGRIADATKSFAGISQAPEIGQTIGSATNNLQSGPDAINAINVIDTFSAILTPLKVFNSIAEKVADVLVFISLYLRRD